ncbi:hypothetical protein [Bacillus sp. Cr_A10]|uniref:hypothetical protein n=1 Tax=Bacillus sp. Cr_A10 TaxID=3033993 RepID=UPI0023D9B87C|nr:hypothetical protein [Bacillus sp. Cr_A10]MDF2067123.1 hypothetical protein [Bacillus sp. Cr_A10]
MKPAFFTYEAEIKHILLRDLVVELEKILLLRKLVAELQKILLLRKARRRKTKDFAPAQSSSQKNKGTLLRSFVFCYDIHNCRIIKEIFFSNGEFRKYTTIKREKCFACYSFSTKFR